LIKLTFKTCLLKQVHWTIQVSQEFTAESADFYDLSVGSAAYSNPCDSDFTADSDDFEDLLVESGALEQSV
jgi:hypothetical protein